MAIKKPNWQQQRIMSDIYCDFLEYNLEKASDQVDYLVERCVNAEAMLEHARVYEVMDTEFIVTAVKVADTDELCWCVYDTADDRFMTRFGQAFILKPDDEPAEWWRKVAFATAQDAIAAIETFVWRS